MKKPWFAKLPEWLSRIIFAYVLIRDRAVIKSCQHCGSWKMRPVIAWEAEDIADNEWCGNFKCEECGAECVEVEHWSRGG